MGGGVGNAPVQLPHVGRAAGAAALVAGGVSEACAHSCPAPGHTNYVTYI